MGIKWNCLCLQIIFCCGLSLVASAQKDTNATYSWNGRIIRYYKVEKGKTLYGISKQFDIPQDTLIAINPELASGLKIGAIIRIPVGFLKQEPSKPSDKAESREHIVQAKETLFGISTKYGLTVDELKLLNPKLEGRLKPGMVLNVQRKPEKIEESKDKQNVQKDGETEKTSKSNSARCKLRPSDESHRTYNVALLLPFYIAEEGEFNPKSKIGLDFYSGARLAFDSLERLGLKLKVFVYDTQNDSAAIKELVTKPEFSKMDLIIGPLYSSEFRSLAQFARAHSIPSISPFSQSSAILENYPAVCKVTPDSKVLARQLAKFLVKKKEGSKFILIKNSNTKDDELASVFRSVLADSSALTKGKFKEITYSGATDLINSLDEKQDNYLFFPSTVQVQVIDLISRLSSNRAGKRITLVGLNEWNAYENIDYDYLNNLNFTYATSTFPDHTSVASRKFQEQFSAQFKGAPSMYGYQGFDVTFYFSKMLDSYGNDFIKCLDKAPIICGFNSCYSFSQKGNGDGFENTFVNILQLDDFELIRLNKP